MVKLFNGAELHPFLSEVMIPTFFSTRFSPPGHEKWAALSVKSLRSVHMNRPRSGGAAATFVGGWPNKLRGKAF